MTTLTAPHPPDPLCWDLGVQGKQTYLYPIHTLFFCTFSFIVHYIFHYTTTNFTMPFSSPPPISKTKHLSQDEV